MSSGTTVEFSVRCKRCNSIDPSTGQVDPKRLVGYSGMMYDKMKEYGQSRPEYCDDCRAELIMEKMTMGAAYYSIKTLPGVDKTIVIPGELGKVSHPDRPHTKTVKEKTFDASKFGATPGKIVEIYEWLKEPGHQVAIIKGGTGSGKSTALPYWLIDPPEGVPHDFFTRDGQIVITQPRIVATTGITKYLGTLLGSSVGKGFDIGYRYSKDRNADKFNAAFMATDGTLISMIKQGQLSDLSVVMIDEAHERSLNIDIILYLLKDQLPLYPHLKVLIVSATINAEQFLDHFGRDTATLIEFEPKSKFSYEKHFADSSEKIAYEDPNRLKKQVVPALVKKVVWLLKEEAEGRKPAGDILGFLQGVKPIDEAVAGIKAAAEADPKLKGKVEVLPLYSALEETESDRALAPAKPGITKVVISTNVAEASVTVEGVVYVVESGIENQAQWGIEDSKKSVELRLISKANAKQRWGRSGRTRDGEVFTLYTKEQFEKMLDFPIPAVHRSSMEEIILKLKELGIDDYDQGWIDVPIKAELERSNKVLKNNGAIDDRERLTEYGALLTQLSYPSDLANLIITADRFGCAVEMATILPVIKNGGFRSFLKHETGWDEPTKQKVWNIQKALWENCHDDAEFILRMYSLWNNPPVLGDEEDIPKNLAARRKEFTETFFVEANTFEEDIEPERARILQLLSAHRKDRGTRDFQWELLERVKSVLAYCVPCGSVKGSYSYSTRIDPDNSAKFAWCELALPNEEIDRIKGLKQEKHSAMFLGQAFDRQGHETAKEIEDRLLAKPVLPVTDTEAFAKFTKRHHLGDQLTVKVVGYAEHAGDFRVSLTVTDPDTGYQTWMTPADLNFTQSAAVVKQIPIGTKLPVVIKTIDPEKVFVQLYCLPLLEAKLSEAYQSLPKADGQMVTKAKIIDVRTDNKIVFAAEMSKPEEGFILVIHATDKVLEKKFEDYRVGDSCLVSFRLESDYEYKVNLPGLSMNLKNYLLGSSAQLSWVEGKLCHKGRLSYKDLLTLAKIDPNEAYRNALDYLYLLSNMNWAARVRDGQWSEKAKAAYIVGKVLEVSISKVLSAGALCKLENDLTGFVRSAHGSDPLKEGTIVKVRVTGYNEERQQVTLDQVLPEFNPLVRFTPGTRLLGTVNNVADYGAFVDLERGFSGLIHISNFGRRISRVSDMVTKGDKVTVEVLSCENSQGRWKISLKFVAKVAA